MKTLVLALGLIMGTLAGPASSTEAVKSPKVLSKGEKATSPNIAPKAPSGKPDQSPAPAPSPPPSSYDISKENAGQVSKANEETDNDFGTALLKMIISLGAVLALLIIIGRVFRGKLKYFGFPGQTNDMKLLTRLPLDSKHVLFVVEVGSKNKLLLGGGNGSLSLLREFSSEETDRLASSEPVQANIETGSLHPRVKEA
ncbi:MAG: flagellar biosynthetic protein FliO [Myxococcota bacterium]|nr:flagellar biosynthetic protein FliO [Myxococcota bacterium]